MSGLVVRGARKQFGSVVALAGADLDVPAGRLLAVLGPSGCGKTTLLRVVAGFERPDAGTVAVGGLTVTGPGTWVAPERRRLGLVPQEGALFPHLSVARNIAFGLAREPTRDRRVDELLELVGLSGLGDRMPHELSGGQQQRVALARALAPRPEVVLLDEPFAALDAGMRADLRAEVREVLRTAGATAVMVTHDQEEALSTADLVAVMRTGRVVQAGPPEELYASPVDLETARFVGDSVELAAQVRAGTASTALGPVAVRPGSAEGVGVALVRPEQLQLVDGGVAATVRAISFHGHDALLKVDVDDTGLRLSVRVAAPLRVVPGQQVGLAVSGPVTFYPGARSSAAPEAAPTEG